MAPPRYEQYGQNRYAAHRHPLVSWQGGSKPGQWKPPDARGQPISTPPFRLTHDVGCGCGKTRQSSPTGKTANETP